MRADLRLLVVEDADADAELMIRRLRAAGLTQRPVTVRTLAEVAVALQAADGFDAVLCDYSLVGFTALDVLGVVQQRSPHLPLIVVTGSTSEEVAVGCIRAGAADYLVKDRLANLAPAIERAIDEAQGRARERESVAALEQSEARFRQAFDDAPVGVSLVSLEPGQFGDILRVNSAMSVITGHPMDQLVGVKSWDVVHPDDRALARLELVELAAGQLTRSQRERRYQRADGTEATVRITRSVVTRDGTPWYAVSHIEDITVRLRAERELAMRGLFDPLTGLPNRGLLVDHLSMAVRQLARRAGSVAVLVIDLDRFRDINDTFGRETGDQVLVEVARRLSSTTRTSDTAARVAGDEFVVVCDRLGGEHEAREVAERITDDLARPMNLGGVVVRVGASVGLTITIDADADAEELLDQADVAMHDAKRQGRRQPKLFRAGMRHPGASRLGVEDYLRSALENGWLRLHYQPVIDLRSDAIVSAEALLRVEHPDRGLIGPLEFIDVAEDSDLILPIGAWVIDQACRQLAAWRELAPLNMAVNISGRQVTSLAVARQVLAATAACDLPLDALCLEITERVLIDAADSLGDDLRVLSDGGVKIAIDDFGTGYSSLTYLQRFPVDTVKIDRAFVSGLGVRPRDEAIVNAVIAMGAALDLTVVAEGVETTDQARRLAMLGCRQVQGYLYAKPLPAADFTRLLHQRGQVSV